ncbi:hypothetical protein ACFGVR_19600 [Mucilaginibacter sp. AW1-3]
MENKGDINNKIEAVLNSLDGISRAEAPPFFYARLEAKLHQRKTSMFDGLLQQMLNRPAIAVSVLTVFLVLNIMAIKGMAPVNSNTAKSANALQNFAVEYNMNTTSIYNNSER